MYRWPGQGTSLPDQPCCPALRLDTGEREVASFQLWRQREPKAAQPHPGRARLSRLTGLAWLWVPVPKAAPVGPLLSLPPMESTTILGPYCGGASTTEGTRTGGLELEELA